MPVHQHSELSALETRLRTSCAELFRARSADSGSYLCERLLETHYLGLALASAVLQESALLVSPLRQSKITSESTHQRTHNRKNSRKTHKHEQKPTRSPKSSSFSRARSPQPCLPYRAAGVLLLTVRADGVLCALLGGRFRCFFME
jgi:hypothetical protein